MATVYTGGTFDMYHAGHIDLFKECKKLAGKNGAVIVALNTDEFIEEYKGKKPIMNYRERLECVLSCKYVTAVIPNTSGADSKPTIEQVNPDIIAVGSDWKHKDYYKQMTFTQEWLDQKGIELVYISRIRPLSTTDIRERVKNEN